ncbi:MAG: FG-GAP repeat protein, partial [Ignavibacteriae bacterium]|nr:FG-GAP repeat protein [Ignavibacteriota bacterium]
DVTMTGEGDNDYFANSVSTAGDINGDGYSDVVIGSIYYSLLTGKAYVYFGGTLMNNIADVTITSGTPGIDFGSSVSSAGDVNGDGYSDFIIGARRNSTPGRAFIFFGGASPDSIPDVSMTGEATGNYFGNSVSSAGDVNGDGYSDVIVGAFGYSSNTGRAYLYNGSAISAKPIFSHVKDVPNDQGGFVNLKWVRSSYDVNGNDLVTYYLVERSYPPVNGNFAWANIAEITA